MVDIIAYLKRLTGESKKNRDAIKSLKAKKTWKDITHTYMDDGRVPIGAFLKISGSGFLPFTGTFDGTVLISMIPFTLGATATIIESKWVKGNDGVQIITIKVEDGTKTLATHRIGKLEILE